MKTLTFINIISNKTIERGTKPTLETFKPAILDWPCPFGLQHVKQRLMHQLENFLDKQILAKIHLMNYDWRNLSAPPQIPVQIN